MKKLKIVHIQLFPLMSGVQRVSLDELSQLDPNFFERIVICKENGEFTELLRERGIRVYLIPEFRREISPISDFLAFLHLRSFLAKERPDIVHTHSSKTGILGRLAARASNIKGVVHTVHGYSFAGESTPLLRFIFKMLERIAAFACDKIIVLNASDAEISQMSLGISPNKLALIPNGVDVNVYSPPAIEFRNAFRKEVFGLINRDHLLVAMIGRLSSQKNPHCFLRAALSVAEKHSDVSFVMVGDGELRAELNAIIQQSRHSERFFMLGWRRDVPDILRAIDMMVLPSRWEGMPLAILEAMAVGAPVICSDIPGNNHIVSDRVDGNLFPMDDSASLADAIEDLIIHPSVRASYASNGRSKILSNYSLDVRMRHVLALYRDLVEHSIAVR
jgi:glycosyltransferase involved in cell wall biosynthesis